MSEKRIVTEDQAAHLHHVPSTSSNLRCPHVVEYGEDTPEQTGGAAESNPQDDCWFVRNAHLRADLGIPRLKEHARALATKTRGRAATASNPLVSHLTELDPNRLRFKGRSSLRQYMPLKPIKRRYKVWIRADEGGYV